MGAFGDVSLTNRTLRVTNTGNAGATGYFYPKVNLVSNMIFYIAGNAQINQVSSVDLDTGAASYRATLSRPEASLVDSLGNNYAIFANYIEQYDSLFMVKKWTSMSKDGMHKDKSRGGGQNTSFDDGEYLWLYDAEYATHMHKIKISDGTSISIPLTTHVTNGGPFDAFHVSKKQECIYLIKRTVLFKLDKTFKTIIWQVNLSVAGSSSASYPSLSVDDDEQVVYIIWGNPSNNKTGEKYAWKISASGSVLVGPVVHKYSGDYRLGNLPGYDEHLKNFSKGKNSLFIRHKDDLYFLDKNTLLTIESSYLIPSNFSSAYHTRLLSSSKLLILRSYYVDSAAVIESKIKLL